jgi:adenylate kinase family enzyme
MSLSKIDDLLDKLIDDFYAVKIKSDSKIQKLLNEINFVKYQKELNDTLKTYSLQMNLSDIQDLFKNSDIQIKITETIKRYLALYIFLYIGFHYTNSDSTYMNNIVEFTKNQPEYNFKIENFFNSDSNALVIKYYQLMKKLINLITADTAQKRETLSERSDYVDVIKFKNALGDDFFKIAYTDVKEKSMKAHNIIKTIILFDIYRSEKKDIFKLIELLESAEGEFMFLDIILPTKETIDFKNIELLLSKKDNIKGMAYVLWDYIAEYESSLLELEKSLDDKITELFESGLVIPVVDDFLLYHKDSERYDRNIDQNKVKKKEDTKIRYIVNKLDTVTNIYNTNNKSEAKKLFYVPMNNKKVVLVNSIEDMKIITKFINQGNISSENSELLKDLENSTLYPFISFKDSPNSINYIPTKTVDTVRMVSFESEGDYKQKDKAMLQMRVGSFDQQLSIVGVFIPSTKKSPFCTKHKHVKDVRTLGDSKNGLNLTNELLNQTVLDDKENSLPVFWLFDTKLDHVDLDTYEQQNKFNNQDMIKHTLGKFYDMLVNEIYEHIINTAKDLKNYKKIVTFDMVDKLINKYQNNKINISKNKKLKELLDDTTCTDLVTRSEDKYDLYDDMVYGLTGDYNELPSSDKDKIDNKNILRVSTEFIQEKGVYEELEKIEGVCQHNITWDRLSELKKIDPKLFIDELYAFVQAYVIENVEHDYVCKSCGFFLDIKKYVQDGKYDDDSQRFVVYGMPLDTPLEDITEYEKFKGSIRSIDKFIEKIALISNVPYFLGNSPTIKSRRKLVIKDTIDIVLNNNILLKKYYKEWTEKTKKVYNVSNSNLFYFELENGIFIYSSKDKDFMKPIKQNNILGYIMFLMMLELNESQISYINSDKKGFCNFQIFDKVYTSVFENLKFRKNNKGDTVLVKNYPIFCYVLYMFACYISKYSLWYYDYKEDVKDKAKKQKFMPIIQKIIINTVIDIINNILENGSESKNIIFEILTSKFYNKLNTTFSNMDLYNKFKQDTMSSTIGESKAFVLTKTEAHKLTGEYMPKSYEKPIHWRKCTYPKMYHDIKEIIFEKENKLTNLSNCENGAYHIWSAVKNYFECKLCNVNTSNLKYSEEISKRIKKNYNLVRLRNLSNTICIKDGVVHTFNFDEQSKKNICIKCKLSDTHNYTDEELYKLEDSINKAKKNLFINTIKNTNEKKEKLDENISYNTKLINKLKDKYSENTTKDNLFKFVDDFASNIKNILGDDLTKNNIYLSDNAYIFDHDYLGNKLDKNIIITDKDNKVHFKSKHPIFNTDIIYYTSYKNGKIDVFYDAQSRVLLGYKEENKQPVMNKNNKAMIQINYSIINKIKLLGYPSQIIDLEEMKKDSLREYVQNIDLKINNKLKTEFVLNIIRNRHQNLKNIIYKFQRLLIRLVNSYSNKKKNSDEKEIFQKEEMDYFINKFDNIVEIYKKKILTLNISSQSGQHSIFKHWKGITKITKVDKIDDVNIDTNTVEYEKINKYDKNGNMLLFYIIDEWKHLIEFNDNKIIKSNICLFIIDFINLIFDLYNEEKYKYKMDYKQFYYFIHSATYIDAVKDTIGITEGVYEEYVDETKQMTEEEKEALEDAKEEEDALDVEGDEIDYASRYDRNADLEPPEGFLNPELTYREYTHILSIYE